MNSDESAPRIRMAEAAGGTRTYLVDVPPEALPAVRARDLHAAWDSARGAALADAWGCALLFRFRRPDGAPTDLALADSDACCWAAAVDRTVGLGSAYGLSVCLRLLALVDLLPRAPWAMRLVALHRDGAALHPGLVRAAATCPLTREAGFDEPVLREQVRTPALTAPAPVEPSGARA